jgi:hypothetical protein
MELEPIPVRAGHLECVRERRPHCRSSSSRGSSLPCRRGGRRRRPRAASSSRPDLCRSLDGASACCKARRRDRVRRHHPFARARTACAALFQMPRTHPWAPCLYSVRRCFGRSASKRNVACCLQCLGCEQVDCSNGCDRARSTTGSWRSNRGRPWESTSPGRKRPIYFARRRMRVVCLMLPGRRITARQLSVSSTGSETGLGPAGLGGLHLLAETPIAHPIASHAGNVAWVRLPPSPLFRTLRKPRP